MKGETAMKIFTLLSVIFPIVAGFALLIWRPENRKTRNLYSISVVTLNSCFVAATVLATAFVGKSVSAFEIFRLSANLNLALAPDGASMVFGGIIGVLWPITTIYAFSYMEHEGRENKFFGFFIITYGVVAGIAFAANFFTMYLFYELMTLATLPLVMHDMDAKARSAGKKYVIYSMSGAALIFINIVILVLYGTTLDFTFGGVLDSAKLAGNETLLQAMFVLGFFGFGVKAAIFPLHDWLPSASVAPTPVTALLHAVAVVKSGAFGVMRLIYFGYGTSFLFGTPAQMIAITASAFTIIYGSILALRTPHLKRTLACSTVANLSYILLAFSLMTPQGMTGGFMHMIYHAVIKITLFFCAGAILHHNRLENIDDMENLHKAMPVTCGVFVIASLGLMGIPPLGGFTSKWTIATAAASLNSWAGYVGCAGLIFSAVFTTLYLMPVVVRFYFPLKNSARLPENCHEADKEMTVTMVLLIVIMLALSLCSQPISGWLSAIAAGM